MEVFSKRGENISSTWPNVGSPSTDTGGLPLVLKHRIKLKAYWAVQDLKLLAGIWYWFEYPRGCPIPGAKAVAQES
jgi:hypothetical protein